MTQSKEFFLKCEKCGKKLIARQKGGLFHFKFGRRTDAENEEAVECVPPVDILICGSVRMKCLRRTCGHLNTFDFWPKIEGQSDFD